MTVIVSHSGPRDLRRRKTKKSRAMAALKSSENKGHRRAHTKRSGRKPRNLAKEARGSKYMSHVLNYINEEQDMIDNIVFDTSKYKLPDFEKMYMLFLQGKVKMVETLFGPILRKQACKEEYLSTILPKLKRETYSSLNPVRLFAWVQFSKDAMPEEEDCERVLNVHAALSNYSKEELVGMQEIFSHFEKMRNWMKTTFHDGIALGETSPLTIDEVRAFKELVESHKVHHKLHCMGRVFEHRRWDDRIDNLYYEANDFTWKSGVCSGCNKTFWKAEMADFMPTKAAQSNCKHCTKCLAKMVRKNIKADKPAFSCGKSCQCFLNVPQIQGGLDFFKGCLEVEPKRLDEMVVSDYCELVLKPWKTLPENILAEPDNLSSIEVQHRSLAKIRMHESAPFTEVQKKEKEELNLRMDALINSTKCKAHFSSLDTAVNDLFAAIKARNDEDMISKCKCLVNPIRSLLLNRVKLDHESAKKYTPDLFGMTMLDIVNMKLQKAKDALTSAYAIARPCAICTATCKHDEEKLLVLHSDIMNKDVKDWSWNSNYGQHKNRSAFRLPCFACKECFSNYLKFKSSLGKPALKCPGMNCECFLKESHVKAIAPVAYSDYQTAIMRYSLKRVKNYRTCPNSCCSAGLVLDIDCNVEKIQCTACDFEFCPHCNDLPHEGRTCEEMRRQRHAERWGDAKDYMENETKQCPFCLAWIEKNGGCNHMTCHHCRGEFCWLCFGDWKTHQDCENKEAVVRRPFNELFPDWTSKPSKKLRPRFAVGKHVTWTEPSLGKMVGRVLDNDANGLYVVEPLNYMTPRKVDESELRGHHETVTEDVCENADEEAYNSFLSGFEDDCDDSGEEEKYVSVELVLKDVPDLGKESDPFAASDLNEVRRLLHKYNVSKPRFKTVSLQKKKQNMSFNQLRKFRAEQESLREADSECHSDDESAICTPWNFFPCSDDEDSEDSDATVPIPRNFFPCSDDEDSECSSSEFAIQTLLHESDSECSDGFSSDDSDSLSDCE